MKRQQQAISCNGTARYTKSSIVHVLTEKDINHMKQNGICFIYVCKPIREKQKNINKIKWILDESSVESLRDICLSTTSIAICTHYHDIQDDAMLTYVGTMTSEYPKQNDCVLLALILQNQLESLDNLMDVQQLYKCCKETKPNINKANCSNHHKGVGYVSGFGSRKEFAIDQDTGSSLGEFVWKDGKENENIFLEEKVITELEQARKEMKRCVGIDLHLLNAAHLKACAIRAELTGLSNDLCFKGDTGYASLFMNFDASTMEPHTKFDMNMTTIFVPQQIWKQKTSDHLTFRFHITGKDDGIISIPMKPGTLIYFHAYLLTHHQVHKNGTCSQKGCCLNFSASANRKLLCYFVKSYHRAKEIMEQNSKQNKSLE